MLPKTLSGKDLRHLRALGHALAPVIAIGKGGVTEAVAKEAGKALEHHELIKVRVLGEAPTGRKEAAEELATATGAVLAQVLGRTFLLYKAHPKKPKIVLPRAGGGPGVSGPGASEGKDGEQGDKRDKRDKRDTRSKPTRADKANRSNKRNASKRAR